MTRFTYNIIYCATVMQDLFVVNSVARHIITQYGVSMMFHKGNINSSIFICFKFVYNLTVSNLLYQPPQFINIPQTTNITKLSNRPLYY